jgi:AmiR/NasT family two-component response regulator
MERLAQQRLIGVAQGVLMHTRGCTAEEAASILNADAVAAGLSAAAQAAIIVDSPFG